MSLALSSPTISRTIFIVVGAACLTPWVSPPVALAAGAILANTVGNPFRPLTSKLTKKLLQYSIIGLGFGINAHQALQASQEGLLLTVASIVLTLTAGYLLGKWLGVDYKTAYLVSAGTAICGGSAIAAVSPLIHAEEKQMTMALGTVFVLNSVALLVFPWIGNLLRMTQADFGLWAALAIHDTSSVVGAAQTFGEEALRIATTVKLARALWIIPLALFTAFAFKQSGAKVSIPYFIGGFVLTMLIGSYGPSKLEPLYAGITFAAKRGLTLTLFLVGAGLAKETLRQVGIRPLLLGVMLWLGLGVSSLLVIQSL
ncbi:YeiH family protein [Nibribacter koreensis]|uniref:Sulfate exporter family transporter n=1 Tax=Nibribacter koreensis TaxID=1084519 RepID=A0ABP8FMS8_9BACT